MDNTTARLHNTILKDRVLWYDGDSQFNSDNLLDLGQRYNILFVDELTPDVKEYNKHVPKHQEIKVKTHCAPLSHNWILPNEYKTLDVISYVFEKHNSYITGLSAEETDKRERRLMSELVGYRDRDLLDVLRAIIFVINTLIDNNVVWGLGRGSSTASYVLYVIGVHDLDSYYYDLNIDDFLHD